MEWRLNIYGSFVSVLFYFVLYCRTTKDCQFLFSNIALTVPTLSSWFLKLNCLKLFLQLQKIVVKTTDYYIIYFEIQYIDVDFEYELRK